MRRAIYKAKYQNVGWKYWSDHSTLISDILWRFITNIDKDERPRFFLLLKDHISISSVKVLLERLSTAHFFSAKRQRRSRDLTFAAFVIYIPGRRFSAGRHYSRLEVTRKSEYFCILIACFYSYASFIILLLQEQLRKAKRVSNSSGKYLTSLYRNQESKMESGIQKWILESGIRNPESGIRNRNQRPDK